MRRQYHPHRTARGVLIWDVHRLIDLSRELALPVVEVPLDSIRELDDRSWFADRSPSCRDLAYHAQLIAETNLDHPILLGADGRLMDGMHRVCKAWMRGDKTIKALRFETDPEPDHIEVPLADLPYDEPW